MIKEITAVGKDILEAKENARTALGAGELDEVQFEIVDAGTKGFFGFMSRPAKVRAFIEAPDEKEKPARREKAEGSSEGGERHGKKRRHRNDKRKPQRTPAENKPTAPVSEIIPEEELKMERREPLDGEDMSFDFVKTVIKDIGLAAEAELYSCEDGTRRITVVGEDASVLIGHHGETLDALQYLANLASARKNINGERDKSRVTIDIEGYRRKREATLRALARRMAQKALRNKRSVMLEPMSAYERRIIHSEIQNIEGVSTNSIGSDNNRKIVIYLTDKKPKGLFDEEKKTPLTEEFAADESTEITNSILGSELSADSEEASNEVFTVEELRPADEIVDEDGDLQ